MCVAGLNLKRLQVKYLCENSIQPSPKLTARPPCVAGLNLKRPQVKYLCENSIRAGVQGNRGEIFAAQAARAHAALNGKDVVDADDLVEAVKLWCGVGFGLGLGLGLGLGRN